MALWAVSRTVSGRIVYTAAQTAATPIVYGEGEGERRTAARFACDAYDVSAKAFTIDRVGRHDIVVVHVVHRTCELLGCSGQAPTA